MNCTYSLIKDVDYLVFCIFLSLLPWVAMFVTSAEKRGVAEGRSGAVSLVLSVQRTEEGRWPKGP